MIFDCLGEYYKSQEQKIRQNFHLAVSTFDVESIHELRVEIKRLRAFFHLIGHINPVFHPEQDLQKILGLFKSAGKIRDIHVQQNMARENISPLRALRLCGEKDAKHLFVQLNRIWIIFWESGLGQGVRLSR